MAYFGSSFWDRHGTVDVLVEEVFTSRGVSDSRVFVAPELEEDCNNVGALAVISLSVISEGVILTPLVTEGAAVLVSIAVTATHVTKNNKHWTLILLSKSYRVL